MKTKGKKRRLALLLVLMMALTAIAGCQKAGKDPETNASNAEQTEGIKETAGTDGAAASEEPYELRMIITVPSEVPSDLERIVAAVNEVTQKDLNITLKFEILPFSTFFQQLPLILSGERVDIISCVSAMAPSYIKEGMLLDIGPLMDQYGQGIVDSFGGSEEMARACNLNGLIYGVPLHKDTATQNTIFFRTDILEKHNLDVSGIKSLADLDAFFEQVSKLEPDMWMLAPDNTGNGVLEPVDVLNDRNGVLIDPANSTEVVNLVETDAFREFCSYMFKWYQNGWINTGAASDSESYYSYIKSGQAFAFLSSYGHPLSESDQEANCGGVDLTKVVIDDPLCSTSSMCTWVYCVAASSEKPEKAVEMISYMMNSPEINNLLNWGIEDEDWVYEDEAAGIITYPDGVTAENAKYHLDTGWQLPNQFLCHVWSGNDPDIYQKMEEYNNSAVKSNALGFTFDSSGVANEMAACSNVTGKYFKALICGAVDPEETIPVFVQELKDAGIDVIIAEKQKQLDVFLAK
jgi:putative aldouronate transport system substrate-binding protein